MKQMQGEHEVCETGERASPEEPWPGVSEGPSHAAESAEADDSAAWHADQATLQQALDRAIAQPIDPSGGDIIDIFITHSSSGKALILCLFSHA